MKCKIEFHFEERKNMESNIMKSEKEEMKRNIY